MSLTLDGTLGLNSINIGATTPGTGAFTNLSYTGTLTGSTGVLAIGTNQIYKDASGNIGIGTSSPANKLHVVADGINSKFSASTSTASSTSQWLNGTGGMYVGVDNSTGSQFVGAAYSGNIWVSGAYPLCFSTNGSERLRIDSSGNVGIGTTNPIGLWSSAYNGISVKSSATRTGVINASSSNAQNTTIEIAASYGTSEGGILIKGDSAHQSLVFGSLSGATYVERIRIDTAGTLVLNQGQIKFPATQNASSDANTLDDYEEGTWTPSINLLGTLTYSTQQGKYTKIGNFVSCSVFITVSSTNSTQDSSAASISGLPFVVASSISSCALTERCFGGSNTTAPHTFHVYPVTGTSYLNIMDNQYNGLIALSSYYSSAGRTIYQGGNLYLVASFSYYT